MRFLGSTLVITDINVSYINSIKGSKNYDAHPLKRRNAQQFRNNRPETTKLPFKHSRFSMISRRKWNTKLSGTFLTDISQLGDVILQKKIVFKK